MQITIKKLGLQDYLPIWQQMLNFTINRNPNTLDELWILQHNPVFTQGKVGKSEHLFATKNIPVVQSDRGGQITYHGPGQLIIYTLLDLRRVNFGIKKLVSIIEQSIITTLHSYKIKAQLIDNAHGVYVDNNKIAALGLRVKNGCILHGLSFNINMDLQPFSQIRPCGLNNIGVCQLKDFIANIEFDTVADKLTTILIKQLNVPKTL